MSDSKSCPECQFVNAAMNQVCVKCQASLLEVPFNPSYSERFADQSHGRNYFVEEIFTPTLFVCAPTSVFCALLAIWTMGSPLTPLFFCVAMIAGAAPFFPGDPVGDFIRLRLEHLSRKPQPESKK